MAQYVEGQSSRSRGCFFWGCVISLAVFAIAAAACGSLAFFGYRGQADAGRVAAEYLDAVAAQDYARAYELLSPAFRERVSAEAFADQERAARAGRGECTDRRAAGVNMQKQSGREARAEIGFVADCAGEQTVMSVEMLRVDGQWRVDGVELASRSDVAPRRCPGCGALSPPGANFCSSCGKGLTPAEQPPPAP